MASRRAVQAQLAMLQCKQVEASYEQHTAGHEPGILHVQGAILDCHELGEQQDIAGTHINDLPELLLRFVVQLASAETFQQLLNARAVCRAWRAALTPCVQCISVSLLPSVSAATSSGEKGVAFAEPHKQIPAALAAFPCATRCCLIVDDDHHLDQFSYRVTLKALRTAGVHELQFASGVRRPVISGDHLVHAVTQKLPGLQELRVCGLLYLQHGPSLRTLTALKALRSLHIKRMANTSWAHDAPVQPDPWEGILGRLQQLRELRLWEARVGTAALLREVLQLTALTRLSLTFEPARYEPLVQIDGALHMPQLRKLHLAGLALTDFSHLLNLTQLMTFEVLMPEGCKAPLDPLQAPALTQLVSGRVRQAGTTFFLLADETRRKSWVPETRHTYGWQRCRTELLEGDRTARKRMYVMNLVEQAGNKMAPNVL